MSVVFIVNHDDNRRKGQIHLVDGKFGFQHKWAIGSDENTKQANRNIGIVLLYCSVVVIGRETGLSGNKRY